MFSIQMMDAGEGDALWIRWGETARPFQMLVDLGTPGAGRTIRKKIENLPEAQRTFELVVVTHIDSDHIGGMLSCFVDPPTLVGCEVRDIWFNAFEHLQIHANSSETESLGARQGEALTRWLRSGQRWNKAFEGKSVQADPPARFPSFQLAGGMQVTVLGPTAKRLEQLEPIWRKQLSQALSKDYAQPPCDEIESMGKGSAALLCSLDKLRALANEPESADTSIANASSITLLLEYAGQRVILGADAWADDLDQAIRSFAGGEVLKLDAFKVPHHGSRHNMTRRLIESVDCPHWLISSDGTRHHHPDAEAIARIIMYNRHTPAHLHFNVKTRANATWQVPPEGSPAYASQYGKPGEGLHFDLPFTE